MTPNDESLTPETVDEYIERLLKQRDGAPADQGTPSDLGLIRKLRHAYETEEANERSLERVWERLAQRSAAPSPTQAAKSRQTHRLLFLRKRQIAMNRPPVQYPIKPRLSYRLGAIVAAILIALLIGGLVIGLILVRQVPHQSVGGNPTMTATSTTMPTPQPSGTSTATLTPTPTATLPPAPTATPPVVQEPLLTYTGHSGPIRTLAWSPNGKWIASAGDDTTVQVWNALTGQPIFTFRQHTQAVNALAWSPDSTRIVSASGSENGPPKSQVFVWNATTGNVLLTYTNNPTQVNGGIIRYLAWSPDSKRVATGGMGVGQDVNTVQVWDSTSGQTIATFRGQPQGVNAVSWSPNGADIAAGGQDGTVQIWKAP